MNARGGQELHPGTLDVTGHVRVDHALGLDAQLLAVVEQLLQRGLVRYDCVDLIGRELDQGQRADRTAAGAENRGGAGVQVGEQPRKVVRACLRCAVPVGIVDRAAVDPPRVGREHGVVDGEQVGKGRERRGIHRGSDEHHRRTFAADLVVQAPIGNPKGRGSDRDGRCGCHRVS